MNIILLLLFVYIIATMAAISSHDSDFHQLNLHLYAYVIFYSIFFVPFAIFMHIFYQSYVFLYFFTDLIKAIYPYRLVVTILFVCIYYLLFYVVYRIGVTALKRGGRHMLVVRMIFLSVISLFLVALLFNRSLYIGTIQDYLNGTTRFLFYTFAGIYPIVLLILLLLFDRKIITKINRLKS